ncbi:recombinase family protein [Desulfosporosinus hippei]|uniref:Site-specific DNA recombinase n=1 Tax=Desulfosporosinus hippei DSM 8344 TaxID=1121419 RepID=A0A1G8CCI7_9FIRM|nr:recombinase family protein [Desulfosporosinus hippei]SDH43059.1 Site-specific DNA recombinase [Desulfosporosinus hippei DSM 8344]
MNIGYARVSTKSQEKDGNSLEAQEKALHESGCTVIYKDSYTGTKATRPEFDKLLDKLTEGDTLVVTKLDRFARSTIHGATIVQQLIDKGIRVNILNIGILDNTPSSKLMRNIFFAFSEYERDMIVERTQEGRAIAKTKAGYKEGRPKLFTQTQIDMALDLLRKHSYTQVAEMTKISKATLTREMRKRKASLSVAI